MTQVLDDDAEIAELAASRLVDAAWYRAQNPDIVAAGLDPVVHFVRYGAQEGRAPNRYFNTAWYVAQNPDIVAAGLNPLVHYLRHGDLEGRRPHPLVDPAWYRHAWELSADTPALPHFLTMRGTGRYAPSAELWAVLHLPGFGDAQAGDDPIGRYLDEMEQEQCEAFPDLPIVATSGLIDPNYYLINASDVHAAEVDPAQHYCRYGWREGRKPSIYFDIEWYTRTNPDLARLRVNPLVHYVLVGEPADRRPVPFFEPGWYRRTYRVPPPQTALAHYLAHRRSQSVSPNHLFDVAWYVSAHAEVLGSNRDPFAHYLQEGTFADIDPSPNFDASGYRRTHLGRPSRSFRRLMTPDRDNPLVHRLRSDYLSGGPLDAAE
ncbi:MAG: hypothetical protein P4L71_07060 [Acetobacteraceae bacterium]|nr:hypothetical protein [Acetobacteraceae bacterium]